MSAPFFGGQGTSDSTERTPLLSGGSGGREMNHVADGSLVVDNDDLPVSFIIPPANCVCGRVYCFHVVGPSVRPCVRPSVTFCFS